MSNTKKFDIKELIFPFFFGGFVMVAVKLSGKYIKNKAIAAIFGGIPLGLISLYLMSDDTVLKYAHNYFFVTLSLLTAIVVFYTLHTYTNMKKNIVLLISLIVWAAAVSTRALIASKQT